MNTDEPTSPQPCPDEALADVSGGTAQPDPADAAAARKSIAAELAATPDPKAGHAVIPQYQHQSF